MQIKKNLPAIILGILFTWAAQSPAAPSARSAACAAYLNTIGVVLEISLLPPGPGRDDLIERMTLLHWYRQAAREDALTSVGISVISRAVRGLGGEAKEQATSMIGRMLLESASDNPETGSIVTGLFGHIDFASPDLILLVNQALHFQASDSLQRAEYAQALAETIPFPERYVTDATDDDRAIAYARSVEAMQWNFVNNIPPQNSEGLRGALDSLRPVTRPDLLLRRAKALQSRASRLPSVFAEGLATSLEFMQAHPQFEMNRNFEHYIDVLTRISLHLGGNPGSQSN